MSTIRIVIVRGAFEVKKSSIAAFACALLIGALICAVVSPAFAAPMMEPFDLGAGKPYAIIQLGDPPELDFESDDDQLEISSNSSVFGNVLKGGDTKDFSTALSTSKVTGGWDITAGVPREKTDSAVLAAGGSENTITAAMMTQIRDDAIAASTFWEGFAGTDLTEGQHSALEGDVAELILTGTTGGANVFNSVTDFKVDGTILTLTGGVGDFFVFNIAAEVPHACRPFELLLLEGHLR